MGVWASAVASFLVALPALFSIVNPPAGALIYHQVTLARGKSERAALAWRVATYAGIVMLSALWVGASLMNFFGVSIEALRIAGGLVVCAAAWDMLYNSHVQETRKEEQASQSAGGDAEAFFPLTMPFTTGPGTISVAIALSAGRPATAVEMVPFFAGLSAAAVVVALAIGICYASADRVVSLLGQARARVLTRLSAFLLLCIGVQIFMTGAQGAIAMALGRMRFVP